MTHYAELKVGQLSIDPLNYRGSYTGIERLADSIEEHGLIQNLVVTPRANEEGEVERYVVRAGNRRLLALDLLVRAGRRDPEEPVMCLVKDDDEGTAWLTIAENVNRQEVAPWNVGHRYLELMEAGYRMADIADHLKVSLGTVSNYVNIARGLHPKILPEMQRMGQNSLSRRQYMAIAQCRDEDDEPHLEDQRKLMKQFLETTALRRKHRARHPKKPENHMEAVYRRLQTLVSGSMKLPPHVHAFINPILLYLNGDVKRPTFPPRPRGFKIQ